MKWTEIWLVMIVLVIIALLFAGREELDIDYSIDSNREPSISFCNFADRPTPFGFKEVPYISFIFPDANNIEEAAKELKETCKWWGNNWGTEFIFYTDIKVTIGGETHTTSFEEFFEWIGFKSYSHQSELDYKVVQYFSDLYSRGLLDEECYIYKEEW